MLVVSLLHIFHPPESDTKMDRPAVIVIHEEVIEEATSRHDTMVAVFMREPEIVTHS